MLFIFSLQTEEENFFDITYLVAQAVQESAVNMGTCTVYCPHTTAGITINENADPDVIHDLLLGLNTAFPDNPAFMHSEGNSCAHLKASCIGASQTLIINDAKLLLGTWQGIYFCEFDGPRHRKFFVHIHGDT